MSTLKAFVQGLSLPLVTARRHMRSALLIPVVTLAVYLVWFLGWGRPESVNPLPVAIVVGCCAATWSVAKSWSRFGAPQRVAASLGASVGGVAAVWVLSLPIMFVAWIAAALWEARGTLAWIALGVLLLLVVGALSLIKERFAEPPHPEQEAALAALRVLRLEAVDKQNRAQNHFERNSTAWGLLARNDEGQRARERVTQQQRLINEIDEEIGRLER
jgi:hypothetical protein